MWRSCYIYKKRKKEEDEKNVFLSIPKNKNNYVKISKKAIKKSKKDNDYYVINFNLDGKYWIINNDKKYIKKMFGSVLFNLYYNEYEELINIKNKFEEMDNSEKEKEYKKIFETIKKDQKIKIITLLVLFIIIIIIIIIIISYYYLLIYKK